MNDVAIIAAALCCAAEGEGPRNVEAFNEIIYAPSAVRVASTALKFLRALKSLIFMRSLFVRDIIIAKEEEKSLLQL